MARSAFRYESKLDVKDAPLVERLQELSRPKKHLKYGYRRMRRLLADEGRRMSDQKSTGCGRKPGSPFAVGDGVVCSTRWLGRILRWG